MEPIRIILAEDQSLVTEGTRQILEQHPDLVVVGEARSKQSALGITRRLQPDVLLVNSRLLAGDGVDFVLQIGQLSPETRVLILVAFDDPDHLLTLTRAGVTGYLTPDSSATDIVEAVRSAYRGDAAAGLSAREMIRANSGAGLPFDNASGERLSAREREILVLAARGMRNKDIAGLLSISIRTVEGHFSRMFDKMGVSSRTEAVLYALSRSMVTV
ncbi:MAG: response regulator transcription factor [Chloroflexi bacterium]|nr:response regulator transcription factor [Chloroflexota bacterium]